MKTAFLFFVLTTFLLLNTSCARVGRPTGGKKDVLPPVTISAAPDFNSVNFHENKIKISFDEYIKFKDLNKQLVISPPMTYAPEITPMGYPSKYITIKIKDTLKKNTTYTFNFGNAIVDNAEGNPLKRFKYLFSTGSYIDSLLVHGVVEDAFSQKHHSNITAMLYLADSTYYDSIIYKQKPNYITNTLDSIGFTISNIKKGKYYIFALDDKNNNLLFDPKNEKIGFINQVIDVSQDSTFQLRLFKEIPAFKIKKISQVSKYHIIIGYEGLLKARIDGITDKNKDKVNYIYYKDKNKDSLHIWYKDIDTDSIFINIVKKDTIITKSVRLRSKEIDSIQITKSIGTSLQLNDSLFLISKTPIEKINNKLFKLLKKDSVEEPFNIVKNKLKDRFLIDFIKEENNQYSLTILPNAIIDYLGNKNDTLNYKFKTKKKEYYGELIISLKKKGKTPLIIELLTEDEKLIKSVLVGDDTQIKFELLKPSKYKVRVIFDKNINNKWDTGSVLKKKQPERVLYYPKTIEIRSNWSINEDFLIN